ncbi:MAG: hypothetical protein A3G39_03600 [Deltaproteobacteria bacterium RIFCSPLOWO2_12_FULL_43_16]|nr:MAG: hypothetical protein A2Z89_09675 [Deltaproteobacteria bacterium GWA2_43_19]OGQ59866.1 MAG: hypothetical protein A3G39_03600 [Deltaproteobacteria bacterium RIFCSPLOWO2_12_FULL_43_16]HBR18124.1 hypothetical protein [Deltaproteobacteria bacterium]
MADKIIKRGIRRRVVLSMLIVGIAPLLLGLYLTYRDGTITRRNSIGASFQEMAKETANKIDMIIRKEVVDVQRLAIAPDVENAVKSKGYEQDELNNYLKKFIGYYDENEVNSLVIVNAKGEYIIGIGESARKGYSNERWFKDAFHDGKGKIYVGDLRFDDALGRHLMSIAAPIMAGGKAIGVVVIKYRVDKLLEVINNVRIETTGHANIVDSSGTIIMCPIFPLRSHHINSDLVSVISNSNPGWGIAEDDAHGGRNSIIGFAPVEATLSPEKGWFDGNKWYIFIRQSPSEIYAPIYSLLIRIAVFGAAFIILLSFVGVYAARKIVEPIKKLYKGVERIGHGELGYRLDINTNDEIEKLADEFNEMAAKLQESYAILENRKKELEVSEERYKDLIENSPEMIHSVNAGRYFVSVNKTELDILGYTLEEMQNKKIEDIMPDEFREKGGVKHIERSMREGISTVETQFITKDGRRIDVEITATALYDPITGNFIRTRAFVRDITDRKKLERHLKEYYEMLEQKVYDRTRELKETKDYLENLFETANDVIYTLNSDGIVTYVNRKIEDWGYKKDELIGKSFLTIFAGVHKGERFKKTILEGIKQTYSVEVINKAGETRYAILSISPIKSNEGRIVEVLGIAKDITEQKMFEQQIAHTEKMSAIGQLAAGIAHEINNPLGGILNCLYNLRKNRFTAERKEEYYKSMEDGIHRVKKIVSQLLEFSQQHEPEFTAVDINSLIEEVIFLLNYAFSKNGIKIEKSLTPNLPLLMLDRHKIQQVFTNILLNAVQAIGGKGQIKVSTVQEDGLCHVAITDSGAGIPPNILPRIFDPFFTTKDVGEGTGLGLSVSKGIVEMHDGKIDVKSDIGKGSTFTIKLPIHSAAERDVIEAFNGNVNF